MMSGVTLGGSRLSFASSKTVVIAAVKTAEGEEFFIKGADVGTIAVQHALLRRFKNSQIQLVACTPQKQQAGLDYHTMGKTLDEAEWKSKGFEFFNRNRIHFFNELAVTPDFNEPIPRYQFNFEKVTSLLVTLNNASQFYKIRGDQDPDTVLLEDKVLFMFSELGLKATDDLVSMVIENQGALFTEDPFFRGYSHVSQLSEVQMDVVNMLLDCNENLYKGVIYNPGIISAYRTQEESAVSDSLSEPLSDIQKCSEIGM